VAAIALAAGGYAIQQHENGNIQHRNSLSEQVASEAEGLDASQPNLAKQLRIAGYDVAHTPQAYSSLFSASGLAGTISLAGVTDAAFSPDGRLLALVAGQQVRLWDRAAQRMAAAAPASGGATGAAFDATGHLLAVAAGNGTTELWDVSSPGHPISVASLTGPTGPVEQVAFSGRGHLLAAAGWDHHVWVWDVSRPARPDRLGHAPGRQQRGVLGDLHRRRAPAGQRRLGRHRAYLERRWSGATRRAGHGQRRPESPDDRVRFGPAPAGRWW
jgi:hypothetical protein